MPEPNRRILIVDDNRAIHADFRKILCPDRGGRQAVGVATAALFDEAHSEPGGLPFELDFASQGQQALELVRLAKKKARPYGMMFIDVRMPPGWDGIETAAKIWEVDASLEIVICTAYSDHSWHQMAVKLNRQDKFVILKKPFDTVEVLQLANAFIEKRRLEQELAEYTSEVEASELRIRTILNALPQPVFVVDDNVRILEFNTAAGALLASDREQVIRQRGGEVLRCIHSAKTGAGCGLSAACQTCALRNSVTSVMTGQPVTRRKTMLEIQTPQGTTEVDMLITAAPIELHGRRLALLILEDVTELIALRGLLPICAHCKSIRNDQQYWQSIESYLHAHMNLDFSHGLCPKCIQKLYPELYEKMLANRVADGRPASLSHDEQKPG
jgi:CheY-like chemotaxis protein